MKTHPSPTFPFIKVCFPIVFCYFCLLLLPACNDGREVNLTIPTEVYLVQAGLQTVGFPESGEPQATLTVYKGGYNDDGVSVRLGISEYALDRYNEENATGYRMLPETYCTFDTRNVELGAKRWKADVTVTFRASELLAELPTGSEWVLPVAVTGISSGEVNADKSAALLLLQIP